MNPRQIAAHLAEAARQFPFLGIETADQLLEALRGELGDERALEDWQPYGSGYVRAVAPKSILHILSGNTPAAALQSLIRGLLIGTTGNLCKVPSSGLPEVYAFRDALPGELAARITISAELEHDWLDRAEVAVVFGSDETIEHFRKIIPATTRFVGYGHKVSVGLIFEPATDEVAKDAARDVAIFDQQGCLSPHVFYVNHEPKKFAAALAKALEELVGTMPRGPISTSEHATIRRLRQEYAFASAMGEEVQLWESTPGTDWTVVYTGSTEFTASCLNRFVFVKPFPARRSDWQIAHLSTAAIWPVSTENAGIAAALGATRICPVGRMQNPAFTWHQDGWPALGSLVRFVDFESTAK